MIVRVSVNFNRGDFNKRVESAVNAGITSAAIAGEGFMKKGMSTGARFTSSSPGSPPNVQRGALRNSITHTTSTNFKASAGTNIRYGLIQERGGIIRPKRSRFLPVPLNAKARDLLETHGRSTQYSTGVSGTGYVSSGGLRSVSNPKLVPVKTKRGALLLVKEIRAGTKAHQVEPWFLLARQIRLPARPWCKPAVDRNKDAISRVAIARAARVFKTGIEGGAA